MSRIRKILLPAWIMIMATVLLTGCFFDFPLTFEQRGWVKKIEEYYPDDSFTVVGHSIVSWGLRSPTCVSVESEEFPGEDIQIYMYNGELYSNYPNFYHREAVEEYFSDLVTSYFGCDDVEIASPDNSDKPLKHVSDKKFIRKYLLHDYIAYMYYDAGHDYPSEDEIVSAFLDYLQEIETDNEIGHLIHLHFCRTGVDAPYRNSDLEYQASLHDGYVYITNLKDRVDIYKHVKLKDLVD